MSLDVALSDYPKDLELKSGFQCTLRPLESPDEMAFHEFFLAVPNNEKMFIKHRVSDPAVIHDWCQDIDLGRNLPLLAVVDKQVVGCATLHQHLGGWKRHIGRVSVLVHPKFRGRGLAKTLINEIVEIARAVGLEKVEAEFIADQAGAMKLFGVMGFLPLYRLSDYVKDMQGVTHDYFLLGLDLKTDEEYAGMG